MTLRVAPPWASIAAARALGETRLPNSNPRAFPGARTVINRVDGCAVKAISPWILRLAHRRFGRPSSASDARGACEQGIEIEAATLSELNVPLAKERDLVAHPGITEVGVDVGWSRIHEHGVSFESKLLNVRARSCSMKAMHVADFPEVFSRVRMLETCVGEVLQSKCQLVLPSCAEDG